ncbi:MAG: hypothetical protein L3J04_09400 [Robiginitomaculum sp.]|nr:hypothetical protein [Robiginitomaculum sp.]
MKWAVSLILGIFLQFVHSGTAVAQTNSCKNLVVSQSEILTETLQLFIPKGNAPVKISEINRDDLTYPLQVKDCNDPNYYGLILRQKFYLIEKNKIGGQFCMCPSSRQNSATVPGGAPGAGAVNMCHQSKCK